MNISDKSFSETVSFLVDFCYRAVSEQSSLSLEDRYSIVNGYIERLTGIRFLVLDFHKPRDCVDQAINGLRRFRDQLADDCGPASDPGNRTIKDNIAYVVADFRRTTAKSSSTDDISRVHFIALGQLLGMRLCFPSFFDLIQIAIDELEAIESEAFSRITESGDVGRSPAGAPVLVHDCGPASDPGNRTIRTGQGSNQVLTDTEILLLIGFLDEKLVSITRYLSEEERQDYLSLLNKFSFLYSGDVGRSSAQSSAALGQGGNQTVTVTNRRQS